MAVTILDVAKAWGAQEREGGISGAEFARLGLPMVGGCEICGATIAAYNACPSTSGYLRCAKGCIYEDGFETVEAFKVWWDNQDEVDVAGADLDRVAGDDLDEPWEGYDAHVAAGEPPDGDFGGAFDGFTVTSDADPGL